MQILGQATVEIDGKTYKTEEGAASLNLGGKVGTTRNGPDGPVGASYKTTPSKLQLTILPTSDMDDQAFRSAKEISYTFIGDNGLTYTVSEAWVTELGDISTGDNSGWQVTLEGKPAQKV